MSQISYLVIDWGTTNFRAFAMSATHELIKTKALNLGLLMVDPGKFGETLELVLESWLPDYRDLPVYMAGMVGSAKGWFNVDYVKTAAASDNLVGKAFSFRLPWGPKAFIMPGVCHQNKEHNYDVMRGEEVQLFGLSKLLGKADFKAVLPGTHSKHAWVENSKITRLSSYLTGEFYSLLIDYSVLGKGISASESFQESAFLKGLDDSVGAALTNQVFGAWTYRLFEKLDEKQVPDYLSGMLIGYELQHLSKGSDLYLIGGNELCKRYSRACSYFDINNTTAQGNECFLAGMSTLISTMEAS
ncbi:2-dehydro-3-deoxygalactonokinase [Alteromonadaceae bacterium M269]|nr:2-dehydro-3-deoxygalactonokinase [Alteromonadaceae bacterium M269]